MEEDGFQLVRRKKKQKLPSESNKIIYKCNSTLDGEATDVSNNPQLNPDFGCNEKTKEAEAMIGRVLTCTTELYNTNFYTELSATYKDCIKAAWPGKIFVKEVICYGLGNFSSSPIARYQLALLLLLLQVTTESFHSLEQKDGIDDGEVKDEEASKTKTLTSLLSSVSHKSITTLEVHNLCQSSRLFPKHLPCFAFDPALTDAEKYALQLLNIGILSTNEQGSRKVSEPTVFYMPHCPTSMYDNLISANLSQPQQFLMLNNSQTLVNASEGTTAACNLLKANSPAVTSSMENDHTELDCPNSNKTVGLSNDISNLFVIGNQFSNIALRQTERAFSQEFPYLCQLECQGLVEVPVANTFHYKDIFNNTAFMYGFSATSL